ncbi:MAG: FkbM family methyltransferase [Rhodothermales bacterium]
MSARAFLKRLLRKSGYDVIRFNARSSPVARRIHLLKHYGITLILDVGASTGGYALDVRKNGYRGRIVSFEPLSSAFAILEQRARRDPHWDAVHAGLGAHAGTQTIHIAQNSESSSILGMLSRHVEAYPESAYVGSEDITLHRLDDVFHRYHRPDDRVLLKIDTQGYERYVLEGAQTSLPHITGIQVEMSLVPLYEGEHLLADMVAYLEQRGYVLMSIEPVIDDPATGQLLQVDGLFFAPDR